MEIKTLAGRALVIGLAFFTALPILAVFKAVLTPSPEVWQHLASTVLPDYLLNTSYLALGVGLGVLLIGVPLAWLCSMYQFPGRRWFEWGLLLPLAMPAYIIAYTYTGMFDFAGSIQTHLRTFMGWQYGDYWFPNIRSLGGAILMLVLVLFPYVYLLARAAFLEQSLCVLEVSRTLGCTARQSFIQVALPLARPAIMTGLALTLMETLADFGTVQYFGVTTFTTGIFRTWYGLGDHAAASQLAAILMSFVFITLLLEQYSRRRARYYHSSNKYAQIKRVRLRGLRAFAAMLACATPLLLGFIIPSSQLVIWSFKYWQTQVNAEFFTLILHSLSLAALAALLALFSALLLAYAKRLQPSFWLLSITRIASIGYAIPGTVVAIGVLIPFAWLDSQLNQLSYQWFETKLGLVFSSSLFIVLFAYNVRFLAVSLQTVDAGLGKIKPSLDNAGRSLGLSASTVLRQIHMPLMRGSLLTALLLVFVDVLKELPATLILRPFNFNTLAVRTYELASDERLAEAGLPALVIVLSGLIPVIILSWSITHARAGTQR